MEGVTSPWESGYRLQRHRAESCLGLTHSKEVKSSNWQLNTKDINSNMSWTFPGISITIWPCQEMSCPTPSLVPRQVKPYKTPGSFLGLRTNWPKFLFVTTKWITQKQFNAIGNVWDLKFQDPHSNFSSATLLTRHVTKEVFSESACSSEKKRMMIIKPTSKSCGD